jgi:hypothetical protein
MMAPHRHCEERSDEAIHCPRKRHHGLLRGACHPAALCADRVARNDGLKYVFDELVRTFDALA